MDACVIVFPIIQKYDIFINGHIIIWILWFLNIVVVVIIVIAVFILVYNRNKINNVLILCFESFIAQTTIAHCYTATQILLFPITTAFLYLTWNYQRNFLYIALDMNLSS